MSKNRKFDIFGLGCVAFDEIIFIRDRLQDGKKYRIINRNQEIGGLVGRAIITAANLGANCSFSCILGQDENSKKIIKMLKSLSINIDYVQFDKSSGPIISTAIISEKNTGRTVFYDDSVWNTKKINSISNLENIKASSVLIIDNYFSLDTTLNAVKIASQNDVPIVADFEDNLNPDNKEIMKIVDHFIVSESFVLKNYGSNDPEKIINKLWDSSKALVAITYGEDGCYYKSKDKNGIHHQPAYKTNTVNSLGCGDVFHGAYAYALLNEYSAEDRIKFSSAAAAIKASGKMPSKKDIMKIF